MKLCPKTAPAPVAQRGGAGFPEARMRALGVPGCGRKFKSCHSDQQKRNEPCVHSASAFLQWKYMKLCPKTAPAPVAQRGGAGFLEARMRASGVPGCGRKFKSWNADHNRGCPDGTSPIIFVRQVMQRLLKRRKPFQSARARGRSQVLERRPYRVFIRDLTL